MIAEVKDWLYVIGAIIALTTSVWALIQSRSKANRQRIATLDERLGDLENRVTHTESILDKDDLRRIHYRIDEVARTTSNIDGQMNQITRSLGVIQQALIKE